MNRRMMFKIGVTLVLGIGILLFYLVHIQDVELKGTYKKVIDSATDLKDPFPNINRNSLKMNSEVDNLRVVTANGAAHDDDIEHGINRENINTGNRDQQNNIWHDNVPKLSDSQPIYNNKYRKEEHGFKFQGNGFDPVIQSLHKSSDQAIHLCVVVCGDREKETLVMLKSAAMVTPHASPLVFHIVAEVQLHQFFKDQLDIWPLVYRERVAYKIYKVSFPEGASSDSWKKLFKPCASQRLFLPELLQTVDSLIYVDTDTLFLRSLADLWSYFSHFNETQLAGLVGEAEDGSAGWYNRFANHPYYGQFGVNSGIMLMNLTRLRQTSWLLDMQAFYKQYRLMIPWGDQDLINIFFSAHPDQLLLMPCHWNYRSDHCKYMSNCKMAELEGVSVLHGSRRMFYENKEPAFAAVFTTFMNYHLGDDMEFHFLEVLKEALKATNVTNCGKVSYVFLKQLQKLLDRNRELHYLMGPSSVEIEEHDNKFSIQHKGGPHGNIEDIEVKSILSHQLNNDLDNVHQKHEAEEKNSFDESLTLRQNESQEKLEMESYKNAERRNVDVQRSGDRISGE